MDSTPHPVRYLAPGWFTRRVFNPAVARMTRIGISLKGSRVLGQFFEGLGKDSSDDELAAAAPGFPAFRIDGN